MEIEGSLSLIVYVTSIFGVNCFWVSVYFQVDAYGGHMGEEGKWGICGEDCPVAAESEGGSQYHLVPCHHCWPTLQGGSTPCRTY